ncbi:MAG: hypothetical protein Q4E71_03510, partial [Prevotella sp.]|nr:hypothetical protein [Prevotella sp.]
MNSIYHHLSSCAIMAAMSLTAAPVMAQESAADSVMEHAGGKRLSVGGYGEVALTRNFFSDHLSRYSQADSH